jgi:nicotinate-nucleotide pyrophosphorylase (carboxylating)
MSCEQKHVSFLHEVIDLALREDIGHSDITSHLIVPASCSATGFIRSKEPFILAGMPFVQEVFLRIDPEVEVDILAQEGAHCDSGETIATVRGMARSLLAGERVSLNILQHLSGIATLTKAYVDRVRGLNVKVIDTRKTLPGLRLLEKYAVRIGGGSNHRFGLYDGILIKDNHIDIAGGVGRAVALAIDTHHFLKIEVEVRNFEELKEAVQAGADVIMLDNMPPADMKEACAYVQRKTGNARRPLLEASGGVTLDNIRTIAETGVDLISVGALTLSARAVDISMKIRIEAA